LTGDVGRDRGDAGRALLFCVLIEDPAMGFARRNARETSVVCRAGQSVASKRVLSISAGQASRRRASDHCRDLSHAERLSQDDAVETTPMIGTSSLPVKPTRAEGGARSRTT